MTHVRQYRPVHGQQDTCDEARAILGEPEAGIGDVFGCAKSSERNGGEEFLPVLGISVAPMKSSRSPVAPMTGQTELTRMLSGARSTAMHFVMMFTAPLVPLYQTRPGRGRIPAVLPMLMIDRRAPARAGPEPRPAPSSRSTSH